MELRQTVKRLLYSLNKEIAKEFNQIDLYKSKNKKTDNATKIMETEVISTIIHIKKKELKERLQKVAVL